MYGIRNKKVNSAFKCLVDGGILKEKKSLESCTNLIISQVPRPVYSQTSSIHTLRKAQADDYNTLVDASSKRGPL